MCKNHDVNALYEEEKKCVITFYWQLLKKNVSNEVKIWCLQSLSEFGKQLNFPREHLIELYRFTLEIITGEEEEDYKILINQSIEIIIDQLKDNPADIEIIFNIGKII